MAMPHAKPLRDNIYTCSKFQNYILVVQTQHILSGLLKVFRSIANEMTNLMSPPFSWNWKISLCAKMMTFSSV